MKFTDKLVSASRKNKSLLCVGLDTDPQLLPDNLNALEFNKAIIDATADLVCAYKPNLAFYEAMGSQGAEILKSTIDYIPDDIPVIADAKRGDIGNTARAYATALFDVMKFDAATVNPYLGYDAVKPFLDYRDKGIFILCRTSNASAVDFQSLSSDFEGKQRPLYEIVAIRADRWNEAGNVGLVVGATYPEELRLIRDSYPDMPLLIPGIGSQGGDLAATVKYGTDSNGEKAVINSSRQILYASGDRDFAAAARKAAMTLRDDINRQLGELPK